MEKIVEIIRIKQEVLEVQEKYEFLKDIQIKREVEGGGVF